MRADVAGASPGRWDALQACWGDAIERALPGAAWAPVPNLGDRVATWIDAFAVDRVVLSGGEDLGRSPARDATERALLRLGLERGLPILGVCRGLEVVQDFFGGPLVEAPPGHREGRLHRVAPCHPAAARLAAVAPFVVPSYHRLGVERSALAAELEAWAACDDGMVEGLRHRSAPIAAVMWHPERPMPDPGIGERALRALADGFAA